MPSFEIPADIFTHLFVFGMPKGSSNAFKTRKNISLNLKRRHIIIYIYYSFTRYMHLKSFCENMNSVVDFRRHQAHRGWSDPV